MELDKKVQDLEQDFKLMRGQLNQTLVDVRDFLHGINLPPPKEDMDMPPIEEEFTVSDEIHSEQPGDLSGPPQPGESVPPLSQEEPGLALPQQGSSPLMQGGERDDAPVGQPSLPSSSTAGDEPAFPWAGQCLKEEQPEDEEYAHDLHQGPVHERKEERKMQEEADMVQCTSQVNLLANLIRWVSAAKKEVSVERLPIFLETYAISGHLSDELKRSILHLAGVVGEESAGQDGADAWSRLILELHGILTGGGAPLRPSATFWQGYVDEEQPEDHSHGGSAEPNRAVRLKLVLPTGDGQEREFSTTLIPDDDEDAP
jgi:hypothetical protein